MSKVVTCKVQTFECLRCEHKWTPRQSGPVLQCPNCKSLKWNEPKEDAGPGKAA